MQKVHSGWLKYNGARLSRDARPLHGNLKPDRHRLAAAFRASATTVEAFLLEKAEVRKAHQVFSRQADPLDVLPHRA
jgi:hypothetical protein